METQTSEVGFALMLMKKVTTAESTFAWVKLVKSMMFSHFLICSKWRVNISCVLTLCAAYEFLCENQPTYHNPRDPRQLKRILRKTYMDLMYKGSRKRRDLLSKFGARRP